MEKPNDVAPLLKYANALVDPLASKRLETLKGIYSSLLGADSRSNSQEYISHVVEEVVSKPLLRRFADPSEKCRCLSIRIFTELLKLSPQSIASLLPYIFPAISERFPIEIIHEQSSLASISEEVQYKAIRVEQSEEVRLILVQLIHHLLTQGKRLIGPFASDVASILMSAASDNDPCVLVEVCSTLKFFADLMGSTLKNICKNLIAVILHALHHNRCRVRVASLQAIERLVLCGAHASIYDLTAYRDPNIIPIRDFYHPSVKTQYLALLASDRSVMVREALLKTVSCWLLELPEKKEHEMRLLPYILNGFRDENKEVQELAFDLMESIGQQWTLFRSKNNGEEIIWGFASCVECRSSSLAAGTKDIQECSYALGSFIDPSLYLEILLPRIMGEYDPDTSMVEIGRTIQVLSWVMQGTRSVMLTGHIPEIFSVLTHRDLITSLQQEVNESIFLILEVILDAFDESYTNEIITILWILLNMYAVGEIRKKPCHERMMRALKKLCKLFGFQTTGDIIIEYLHEIANLLEAPLKWAHCMQDAIICIWLLEEASSLHNPAYQKLIDMLAEFIRLSKGDAKCGWLIDRISSRLSKEKSILSITKEMDIYGASV